MRVGLRHMPRRVRIELQPIAFGVEEIAGPGVTVCDHSVHIAARLGDAVVHFLELVERVHEEGNLLGYARRIRGSEYTAPVFEPGSYVVRVGDPDAGSWLERTVEDRAWGSEALEFDFTG